MAEGACLESMCTVTRTGGSNPPLSVLGMRRPVVAGTSAVRQPVAQGAATDADDHRPGASIHKNRAATERERLRPAFTAEQNRDPRQSAMRGMGWRSRGPGVAWVRAAAASGGAYPWPRATTRVNKLTHATPDNNLGSPRQTTS